MFFGFLVVFVLQAEVGARFGFSGPVELGQATPEWAKREYESPAAKVYAAALKSVQQQKHEVQTKSENIHTVDFHVGMTAWSWGYNMRLVVTPVDEIHSTVTVGVLRSGGKVFSWGSGDKEVRKILAGIDAELASAKANAQESVAVSPSLRTLRLKPSVDAYYDCVFVRTDRRAKGTVAPSDIADAALAECANEYDSMQSATIMFFASDEGYAAAARTRDDVRRAAISRVLLAREP